MRVRRALKRLVADRDTRRLRIVSSVMCLVLRSRKQHRLCGEDRKEGGTAEISRWDGEWPWIEQEALVSGNGCEGESVGCLRSRVRFWA